MGQGAYELHTLSGLLSLVIGFHLVNIPIIQTINAHRQTNDLPPIGVKWANDMGFYDDKTGIFRKLAGILIEPVFKKLNDKNTPVGVVVGVGLNVNNSPMIKDGLYQATCLNELSDINTCAQDLYIPMTNTILEAIQICNHCKKPIFLQNFIKKFNADHLLTNKLIHIFIQNNMTDIYAKGKCIGIGSAGELLLNDGGDIKPIFAGMAKIVN